MKKLSPDAKELCKKIIDLCRENGEVADACIACKLDVQEEVLAIQEQLDVATKLLQYFGDDTAQTPQTATV